MRLLVDMNDYGITTAWKRGDKLLPHSLRNERKTEKVTAGKSSGKRCKRILLAVSHFSLFFE